MDALSNRLQVCLYGLVAMPATRTVKSLLAGVMGITRWLIIIFVIIAALIRRYFMKKEKEKYRFPQKQVNQHSIGFKGNIKSKTKTSITTYKYKGKRV